MADFQIGKEYGVNGCFYLSKTQKAIEPLINNVIELSGDAHTYSEFCSKLIIQLEKSA